MSIYLTDEIEVKTKKGKLGAAKQIFLEGDTQTVEKEIQDINSKHNDLSSKHESLSSTVSEHTKQIESNQSQITANKSAQDEKNTSLDENMKKLNTRDDQITESLKNISATGGASVASAVTYNNTTSQLTSANIQGAIDEVAAKKADKSDINKCNVNTGVSLIPNFNIKKQYKEGNRAMYKGLIYVFNKDHLGEWKDEDVNPGSMCSQVTGDSLVYPISQKKTTELLNQTNFACGNINIPFIDSHFKSSVPNIDTENGTYHMGGSETFFIGNIRYRINNTADILSIKHNDNTLQLLVYNSKSSTLRIQGSSENLETTDIIIGNFRVNSGTEYSKFYGANLPFYYTINNKEVVRAKDGLVDDSVLDNKLYFDCHNKNHNIIGNGFNSGNITIHKGWMNESGVNLFVKTRLYAIIPISKDDVISIGYSYYAFLSDYKEIGDGESFSLCAGENVGYTFGLMISPPQDAKYLYVGLGNSSYNKTPNMLIINGINYISERLVTSDCYIVENMEIGFHAGVPAINTDFYAVYSKVKKGDIIFYAEPKLDKKKRAFGFYINPPRLGMSEKEVYSFESFYDDRLKKITAPIDGYVAATFHTFNKGVKFFNILPICPSRQEDVIDLSGKTNKVISLNTLDEKYFNIDTNIFRYFEKCDLLENDELELHLSFSEPYIGEDSRLGTINIRTTNSDDITNIKDEIVDQVYLSYDELSNVTLKFKATNSAKYIYIYMYNPSRKSVDFTFAYHKNKLVRCPKTLSDVNADVLNTKKEIKADVLRNSERIKKNSIIPFSVDDAYNTFKTPLFDCHRGVQAFGPENSIPAFLAGGKEGVWAIETDFRMTSDGIVVCMHDPTLDRTTTGTGNVSSYTYEQIRAFKLKEVNSTNIPNKRYKYNEFTDDELRIPTMEEYLKICATYGVIPFIELKEDNGIIDKMLEAIKKYRLQGKCVISSSDMWLLTKYRNKGGKDLIHHIFSNVKNIDTLLSLKNAAFGIPIEDIDANIYNQYVYKDYNPKTTEELVEMCHSLGLKLCFRACDTPDIARRAIEIGLDYMPSNNLWSREQLEGESYPL